MSKCRKEAIGRRKARLTVKLDFTPYSTLHRVGQLQLWAATSSPRNA